MNKKFTWPLMLIFFAFVLINFNYGFSEDHDGYLILQYAQTFGLHGYRPTRAFGYPLFDLVIDPIIFYGGENAGKLYAMILASFSVLLFYQIIFLLPATRKNRFWPICVLHSTPSPLSAAIH